MPVIPSYRHSGKFEPTTFPFALGLGLVGALGVGWLYQFLVDLIPFIYIRFILTAAFGAALGWLVGWGAQMGKCRNLMLVSVMAFSIAVVAEGATMYYQYQRTIGKILTKDFARLQRVNRGKEVPPEVLKRHRRQLMKQFTFQHYLEARVKYGWKMKSTSINGVMVYIIWGLELLILIVAGVFLARTMVDVPFCERGNVWATEIDLGGVPHVVPEIAQEALAAGDINFFIDVANLPVDEGFPTVLHYTLYQCVNAGYLSVKLKTILINDKGEQQEESVDLLEYAHVDGSQVEHLRHELSPASA